MATSRNRIRTAVISTLAAMVLSAILPQSAKAAPTVYFHINGTSPGYGITANSTNSWDGTNWTTSSTGAPTAAWTAEEGDFAEFNSSITPYTVTLNNDESTAGIEEATSGVTVTLNAAGSGKLDEVTGDEGFICNGTGNLIINAPITGPGGVAPEGTGSLYLYGNNTYTGGTTIGYSSATLTYFNSSNSFGTGPIKNNSGVANRYEVLLGTGGATITVPNNFIANTLAGNGYTFASDANTPVISTGTWAIGAVNMVVGNNTNSTSPVTIQGVISGSAGMTFRGTSGGAIILTGANLYSGTTTVGMSGGSSITVRLGAANTIASSSQVIMNGGTLDPDGINQAMSATTMALAGTSPTTSVLTYANGIAEVDFANSSAVAWTSGDILNLTNWTAGITLLRFGTTSSGLTSGQLAEIEFNGANLGAGHLDANGYLVPEPASLSLFGLGATMLLRRKRRA